MRQRSRDQHLSRAAERLTTLLATALLVSGCGQSFEATVAGDAGFRTAHGWPEYGGGGGQRYTTASQIDKDNVSELDVAWVYRTGDVSDGSNPAIRSTSAFEVTPIIADGALVFCTPFNRVIALDPLTGGELWTFDPGIDLSGSYANQLICRGVSFWRDGQAEANAACAGRIFTATNDGHLIALDSRTGQPCAAFGTAGRIDLNRGPGEQEWLGEYQLTSPPAIAGDRVIVGSAISDNQRIDAPSGVVRAFDARSGVQLWAFDLAPPDFDYTSGLVSEEGFALGTPNVWGPMAVDEARQLIYLPTGNPAPDYFRPGKPDMDYYGTSVVALEAVSGKPVWHFNAVINDFWDLDVGAQPSLVDLRLDGRDVPALVLGTKMGFVFVLDRETGEPVVDVEYRNVPREGPLAEQLSPVQPYPPTAFQVAPNVAAEDAWGLTPWDTGECEDIMSAARTGPLYTPITEEWTVVAPSNMGGINWGGVAVDPERGRIHTRSSNVPFLVKLIERAEFGGSSGSEFGVEFAEQRGMPYAMARRPLL